MVTHLCDEIRAVLDVVHRYRLTTAEIIAARRTGGTANEADAERLCKRLVEDGWLRRGTLCHGSERPMHYYFLGRAGVEALGVDASAARELSLDHRLERYAIARFCSGEQPFRELMTKDEFQSRFPDLARPGQPLRYYLESDSGNVRLAFLKVDIGGASRWERPLESCLRFLAKRTTCSAVDPRHQAQADTFRQMIEQERFQVSLLVASPEKAAAIATRLDIEQVPGRPRPPIRPYVVPGLFALLLASSLSSVRKSGN
jgi:hypothetical protein